MNINSNHKSPQQPNNHKISDDSLDHKKNERQKEKNNRKKKLSQALRNNLQRRKSIIES